jgi:ATP-dependent protease ClpP protease subunit
VPGPQSRYILPQFEERTSYGMKRLDPYTKLFEDRIIFLGVQVDDASADDVIAQLHRARSPRTPTATSSCTSTAPAARSRR